MFIFKNKTPPKKEKSQEPTLNQLNYNSWKWILGIIFLGGGR
jgi:hypothetical protein